MPSFPLRHAPSRRAIVFATLAIATSAQAESLVEPRGVEPVVEKPSKPAAMPQLQLGVPSGRAKIERVWVTVASDATRATATLTLELVGADTTNRDVTIPITIPPGATATGLGIAGVAGGHLLARAQAAEVYRHTVEHIKEDPALLEWRGRSRAGDQLVLRAFPVASESTMQVAITLELPRVAAAQLDLGGQTVSSLSVTSAAGDTRTRRGVSGKHAIELVPPVAPPPAIHAPLAIAPRLTLPEVTPGVDAQHSLIAGGDGLAHVRAPAMLEQRVAQRRFTAAVPIVSITAPTTTHDIDKTIIRRYIKRQHAQLRHCYTVAVQRDPSIEGTAAMQFVIHASGSIAEVAVTGELDAEVRDCIRKEVATWRFPRSDSNTRVSYPLTFRLSGA